MCPVCQWSTLLFVTLLFVWFIFILTLLSTDKHVQSTFLFRFTENGFVFVNGQQSDVVIVYNVLRVFKAIMGQQEVADRRHHHRAELVAENDVEHVRRSFIVLRQACFTKFPSCAIELPVDILQCDKYQPQQLVRNGRHKLSNQQPVTR